MLCLVSKVSGKEGNKCWLLTGEGREVQEERDRQLWDTPLIPALHGDKTMKYSISMQNQASVGMLTIIKNGLVAPTSLT